MYTGLMCILMVLKDVFGNSAPLSYSQLSFVNSVFVLMSYLFVLLIMERSLSVPVMSHFPKLVPSDILLSYALHATPGV